MTAGQRRTHLLIWLILGPLALIGLAVAVIQRPAEPVQQGPLPGLEAQDGDGEPEQGGGP